MWILYDPTKGLDRTDLPAKPRLEPKHGPDSGSDLKTAAGRLTFLIEPAGQATYRGPLGQDVN